MGINEFNSLGRSIMVGGEQANSYSKTNNTRIIYPAKVVDFNDATGMNRIKARIINVDENGKESPGKDKDFTDDQLPVCIPIIPEFLHVRPKIDELVYILSENPEDVSSVRFWIGPVISSPININFENFQNSIGVYDLSSFKNKERKGHSTLHIYDNNVSSVIPKQNEIAIQGRQDSDIIFRNREVEIVAGKFEKDSTDLNTTHHGRIIIKQFDKADNGNNFINLVNNDFKPFSQTNIISTNINLISTEGKNRNFSSDNGNIENSTNKDNLKRYGDIATQLHPLVLGDELIKLLKIMLNFMLTHVHTPQNPAVSPANDIAQLSTYKDDSKIQEIVSKNVRTN